MSTLNEAQKMAVETKDGPVLIIAGAGAGKTKVITERILNLIHKGVDPASILAITFTNKAAKEMRERAEGLINNDKSINRPITTNERPFISTFHALGVKIIRDNANILGLNRHFSIYDRGDSRGAIKEALVQCSLDPKKFEPGAILEMISRSKSSGVDRLKYSDHAKGYMEETVAQVWEKYDSIMTKEGALDFDDLLLKTAQLLEKDKSVRDNYNQHWKYIHIDEYQDTNHVQYRIAKYLAGQQHNICVVGDADQNIYSWRGATIENILRFEKDYPNATVITLEKNYRSTKTILAAANNVIVKNKLRKDKNLYTDNDQGDKIGLVVSYTEKDEARAVAEMCRSLIEQGEDPKEIAVLYRTNFQSRVMEEYFLKKNIPYQLIGTKFFERKEIKDILSYVRASLNPESWADIGRIINVPPRGIGKATIAKVMSGNNDFPPNMKDKLANFWKLLSDIRSEIKEKKPSEAIKFIIKESGMESMLQKGDSEDEEKLLNIRELVSVATQYDSLGESVKKIGEILDGEKNDQVNTADDNIPHGIEALLDNAALATDQDDLGRSKDAVRLMTVHASKGLEFNNVFIVGMEQDLFPFKHVDESKIDKYGEEEERRLFYVALTRAKKRVTLSLAIVRTIYGAQRVAAPSEFIEDIEKNLIEDQPMEKPSGAKAIFIDF